jgi:hypothetical protein
MLGRDGQTRDIGKYLETSPLTPSGFKLRMDQWVGLLVPVGSADEDRCMFSHDLAMVAERLAPSAESTPASADLTSRPNRLTEIQSRYSRGIDGATESAAAAAG